MTYETPIDRAIREAAERGEFDNLPDAGKPLSRLDSTEDEWLRRYAEREGVFGQDFLPEALRVRREAETIVERHLDQRSEAVVRREVEALNLRIRNEIRMPTSPLPLAMRQLDVDEVVAAWASERVRRQPAPTEAREQPEVPRRRWWQRQPHGLG